MAKEKSVAARPMMAELFQVGIYKRNQGRIARQVTFFAIAIVIAVGCYQLSKMDWLTRLGPYGPFVVPMGLALVGWWAAFRAMNVASFADFLISVEAEMTKVSWPTRGELLKASFVVLLFIILLAAILFVFDYMWMLVFTNLNVI